MKPPKYNYLYDIPEIQAKLENGESRIVNCQHYMADCFSFGAPPSTPTFPIATPSKNQEIDAQYREEIKAISENIKKHSSAIGLDPSEEAATRFEASMILQNTSRGIWNSFALPLRFQSGKIYRIWASQDITDTPIVESWSIEDFLRDVAIKTAKNKVKVKQLESWLAVCIIILTLITLWLLLPLYYKIHMWLFA